MVKDMIIRKTRTAGIDFEILPSKADGSYENLQKIIQKDAITDVVICGGDGTVNAVVNALQGVQVQIGIIPVGSGNSLAFAAKIPKQPGRALDIIFKGNASPVDAFKINEKFSCALVVSVSTPKWPMNLQNRKKRITDLSADFNYEILQLQTLSVRIKAA
jgi:diacylglycerol kinase family enzyme